MNTDLHPRFNTGFRHGIPMVDGAMYLQTLEP
jgi:hypothetical protein